MTISYQFISAADGVTLMRHPASAGEDGTWGDFRRLVDSYPAGEYVVMDGDTVRPATPDEIAGVTAELQAEADAAAAAELAAKVAMVNDDIKAAAMELQGCIVMLAMDYGIVLDSEAGYNQVHDAIYNPALPIDGAKRAELKSLIDSRFNTLNYRWEKATGKDDAWANLGIIQQAMMGG